MSLTIIAALTATALLCTAAIAHAAPGAPTVAAAPATAADKPAIVLVHGAFADGSSWSKVIPLLEAKGYRVVAVQNPYISLAGDVSATDRVVNQQPGKVVLVGHSSGGTVITQAGNNPKVAALVFVSANAPDSGQSINDLSAGMPPAPWAATLIKDEAGYLTLPASTIVNDFAPDLSPVEKALIVATQVPWFSGYLDDKVTHASWHEKPSWWVMGEKDHMIAPSFQAAMAARIGAKVIKAPTSHVVMLADPKIVTGVIINAAEQVQNGKSGRGSAVVPGGVNAAPALSALSAPSALSNSEPSAKTSRDASGQTVRDVLGPAAIAPVSGEPPVRLLLDPPLADSLAQGRVVIQYRTENLRIEPVFGKAALAVSPRIGHLHITVDDAPWHWLDASGDPLVITGLTAGPHKVLIELVNAAHQTLDYQVVRFDVAKRSLVAPDPKADGFRAAPDLALTAH